MTQGNEFITLHGTVSGNIEIFSAYSPLNRNEYLMNVAGYSCLDFLYVYVFPIRLCCKKYKREIESRVCFNKIAFVRTIAKLS